MKKIGILLGLLCFLGKMNAQTLSAKDSAAQTIRAFFEGMKNADTAAIRATLSESAVFQTISTRKTGETDVKTENIDNFLQQIGSLEKGKADERITFGSVLIDGALAAVWTPYQFYFDGKFSHCGVNSFQLVKIEGVWKIQYIIDTRRRKGCE